jgi:carbonic anhydrase
MTDDIHSPLSADATPPPETATQAGQRLIAGNAAFIQRLQENRQAAGNHPDAGTSMARDASLLSPEQKPFAAVLGCSDARVPTEMVFNQPSNHLFIVRVAGNVLGGECLGSLEYAATQLSDHLRLIAVLGHSSCGAVTAAVDAFLEPARYPDIASSHGLRTVVDRIFPPVRAAARAMSSRWGMEVIQRPGYRQALIELSVSMHAAFTAWTLRGELHAQLEERVGIVFGVFDLETSHVWSPGSAGEDVERHGLAPAPVDRASFLALEQSLSASPRISTKLDAI